jgi:hypothetical protein
MRRVLLAALFAACSFGICALPAGAVSQASSAGASFLNGVVLSFDFSDNSAPASTSEPFNVIADVLPENTGGIVRMVAIAPATANVSNLVCDYIPLQHSEIECAFNFTADGVWQLRAEYATDAKSAVSSVSVTALRVQN